jgi:hypothetical protein
MASLLEQSGGQPQKQPRYASVFNSRFFTGLYTQRAALHSAADIYTERFYGGRPEALWLGANVELSNNFTLKRRPGLSPFRTGGISFGIAGVQLGTAGLYAALGYSGITNTGNTVISGGNIGSFPTNSISGFPPGTFVPPAAYVTATAQNQTDLTAAFVFFNGLTPVPIGGSFGTTTFTATATGYNGAPGFVGAASSTLHFTGGTVTLDGAGLSNPVFVFQVGSALNVDTAATTINLINGASAVNVVWVVGSATTFDAHTHIWAGNILATSGITLNGGTLTGRALVTTGPVTISSATNINMPTVPFGPQPGGGPGNGYIYPTQPLTAYSFQLIDGTIRVIIDTGSTGPSESDTITSVAASVNGQAVYTGSFTSGANNGLQGQSVTVAGFTNSSNNGVFAVFQSTATTLTLVNASAISESHAATAATIFLTSVAAASGTGGPGGTATTVYTGTITNGAPTVSSPNGAYAGLIFLISGFGNGANKGAFVCVASTNTTLTLANPNGLMETANGTAVSAGAVYWDQQNGNAQLLFAKSPGAGQTHFIGSGGILFFGDGVDVKKYTPLNVNFPTGSTVSVWNWGITAPAAQPGIQIVSSGAASTVWQANTIFSTMGLTYDATNHQVWQLIGVNADPTNPNITNAQFGTSGTGGPPWNQSLYGTTTETTGLTWQNVGQLAPWAPSFVYGDAGVNGTAAPVVVYDSTTSAVYLNFNGGGGLSRSGTVKPPFTPTAGWNYTEQNGAGGTSGGITYNQPHWFFFCTYAQAQAWKPSHSYSNWYVTGVPLGTGARAVANVAFEPFIFPPPTVGLNGNPPTAVYLQVPTSTGTSGSTYTPFPAVPLNVGQQQTDGQLLWQNVSTPFGGALSGVWHASTTYVPWTISGAAFGVIFDGTNLQVVTKTKSGGPDLSGTVAPGTTIAAAVTTTVAASTPLSGEATYTLSTGSWVNNPPPNSYVTFTGFTNAGNNGTFQVVSSTNNSVVVSNAAAVNETHTQTAVLNAWGTTYGATTQDGNLTWTCVGPSVTWTASTIWNLPLVGFAPPQLTQPYGGSSVDAANGTVQAVIVSGKSASSGPPAFGVVGTTTMEGPSSPQLTWYAESLASTNSLAFTKGYSWAYSYKARALDDIYSAPPLGGIDGVQQIPPGTTQTLPAPFGSETNAVSSASPANVTVGSNAGAVITVSGVYSSDPQVDTIIIWRSVDGGGSSQMFELTEIPNVVGGGVWHFQDFLPDIANGIYPGLNTLIPAPINGVNDPPVSTFLPQVYHFQRIFGIDGQFVAFSGGPDTHVGNPDEAFSAVDSLPFLAPVNRVVKSAQGLFTFLTNSIEFIGGGPATSSFSSITAAPGIGLLSWNALDVFAGEIYFFSADNQFRVMTPSLNITNAGFPIGDQFANQPTSGAMSSGVNMTWDPKQVYVASYQNGTDNAIFVGDGNTGWYRLNPRQAGAMPNTEPVWSPYAIITNGCQMVVSVNTSQGISQLLVGPQLQNQTILVRNQLVFTDNGTQYDAFFEMGNIVLVNQGQIAALKFCAFDFSNVSFQPTVSYLLNEIAGNFVQFTLNPVFDPPSLYGQTITPGSYSPNRYYFSGTGSLARCRHLRIRVDYGKTSIGDEIFNTNIFGRLFTEA